MIEYKTIKHFKFEPNQIEIKEIPIKYDRNKYLQKEINDFWQEMDKKAKSEGKRIWDSQIYTLSDYRLLGDHILMKLGVINYRTYFYFRNHPDKLEGAKLDPGLGVGALIKTTDDKYIFGVPNTAFNDSSYVIIGGGCVKSEMEIHGWEDFMECFYKELLEEIGVDKSHVTSAMLSGFIGVPNTVQAILKIELDMSSEEVIAAHKKENDGEISNVIAYTKEEIFEKFGESEDSKDKVLVEWMGKI